MTTISTLIENHIHRYPELQVPDVYRLLHQATCGASHAITNKKSTREWLEHELDTPPPESAPPLLEPIANGWVRLYLHPYKAFGGEIKPLLTAILKTEKITPINDQQRQQMDTYWQTFLDLVTNNTDYQTRFEPQEIRLFGRIYAEDGYPTAQHSREYYTAYKPSYRVLRQTDAEALLTSQNIKAEMGTL